LSGIGFRQQFHMVIMSSENEDEQLTNAAAALKVTPYPFLLVTPELEIMDANAAYMSLVGKTPEELIGRYLFDAFPPNTDGSEDGARTAILQSVARVVESGQPDTLMYLRYSIGRNTGDRTVFEERYWNVVSTPVLDAQGKVRLIVSNPIDVTELRTLQGAIRSLDAEYDFSLLKAGNVCSRGKLLEENLRKLEDERARLRRVFQQAPGFVAVLWGPEFVFDLVNDAYYQLVGKRDLIGRTVREVLPELEGQGYYELLDKVYRTGEVHVARQMPLQVRRTADADMSRLYVDFVYQPLFSADGVVAGIFVQGQDVTQQKHAQDVLRVSNERFRLAIEGSQDGVWDWDLATNRVMRTRRWKEILGYDDADISDRVDDWKSRIHPDDRPEVMDAMAATMAGAPYYSEHRLRCKDGSWKWVLMRAVVTARDTEGRPLRITGTLSDISKKKQTEEVIWSHASFDFLTGLPNRRLFRDRLDQEIRKANRSHADMALLYIDLDRFKEVNDLLGHDAGDLLLKQVSDRLLACVRESDTVARLGGDEFTVILTALSDHAHVDLIAQKIIATLAEPFDLQGEAAHISASVGITLYPADARSAEDLMRNADQAMYVAKHAGRSQFRYFTRAMQEEALLRLELIRDLRGALANQQLQVHFQPVIDLRTGRIVKGEALLRWDHPRHGPVEASRFVRLAEEAGLINELGDWVLRQAATWSERWSARQGQPFEISVNRSPLQFVSKKNDLNWVQFMKETGLPRHSIAVEITEGVLLNATASVVDMLLQYRDAGIHVALDDFGTGYSSMSYLVQFDIDYLKIDQSFVQDIERNRGSMTIAEAMILMAHGLGLKVIAEGVETEGQAALLREAGCDYAQGFLFSKALAPQEFEQLLTTA
jgi:diguanylate cyclase (GGDEF)-like protein/PAS domain S-box-containing protein